MKNFDVETYHIWRPDFQTAIKNAISQKKEVIIQSHMPLDKCNSADVTLFGNFLGLSHHTAQYVVNDFDLDPGNNFPADPECEYTFSADVVLLDGMHARMEYGGRAAIIDRELQRNNLPESLLMRISPPGRMRRLRRHERQRCPKNLFLLPGLMLMDNEPINRRRLLALLGHYYRQKTRPKPVLIDISAGGACLESDDPRCSHFLGCEESYLFFFFSENNGLLNTPTIFMAKKVGNYRGETSKKQGIRLRFLKELVWTGPNEELKWKNIEQDGSESIKRMLDQFASASEAPAETPES